MENSDLELLKKIMIGRGAVYEYLSLVFKCPPKEDFIGISRQFLPIFEELSLSSDEKSIRQGVEFLKEYISYEDKFKDTIIGQLNSLYTMLFSLGFNSVPTSASAMLMPGGTVKSKPWEKVMDVYRQWGFKPSTDFKEPEDHIYCQLKFMEKMATLTSKLLSDNEIEKARDTINAQKSFLNENITIWVSDFCKHTILQSKGADCKLYTAAAYLTDGYIKEDINLLAHIYLEENN